MKQEASLNLVPAVERKQILERLLSRTDVLVLIVGLVAIFTALDFYSHPHQGAADLERRKLLMELIGPITKHLGNFGLTAAASISAVFMKHLTEFMTFSSKIGKRLARASFMGAGAVILALNALSEVYPGNTELGGDLSMAGAAFLLSIFGTEAIIGKIKQGWAKTAVSKPD